MRTRALLALLPVLALGAAVVPASAAKPAPIKATYTASAPVPGAPDCSGLVPGSIHKQTVKLPAAGTFKAELTGFAGDWDFYLRSSGGALLSSSTGGDVGPGATEIVLAKVKKATTVSIESCNWAGGPTGTVSYVFTYA